MQLQLFSLNRKTLTTMHDITLRTAIDSASTLQFKVQPALSSTLSALPLQVLYNRLKENIHQNTLI